MTAYRVTVSNKDKILLLLAIEKSTIIENLKEIQDICENMNISSENIGEFIWNSTIQMIKSHNGRDEEDYDFNSALAYRVLFMTVGLYSPEELAEIDGFHVLLNSENDLSFSTFNTETDHITFLKDLDTTWKPTLKPNIQVH